jgi:putative membrane protein
MPGMAAGPVWPWLVAAVLVSGVLVSGAYLLAAAAVRHRGGRWPHHRDGLWCAGVATASAALCGPVAARPGFPAHMTGHVLLGMAAPLLLASAAPMTLLLRTLPVDLARGLTALLRSPPVRVLTHPVTAATLDAGGLWVVYTTGLYAAAAHHGGLHLLVHAHVFAAGYLFTVAVVGVDPMPHRPSRILRAVVLLAFLAAHGILAKYLYAHPPLGVPGGEARAGSEIMYYGGDLVDLVLLIVFCRQWYRATAPRGVARAPRRLWMLPAELRTGDPG